MIRIFVWAVWLVVMAGGMWMLINGAIGMYSNSTRKIVRKQNERFFVLEKTAKSEHELGWLPHGDRDVLNACPNPDCREASGKSRYRLRQVP